MYGWKYTHSVARYWRALQAEGYRIMPCSICGRPVDITRGGQTPMSRSVDHYIATSRGGSIYDWTNWRVAHLACNKLRGNRVILRPQPALSRDW